MAIFVPYGAGSIRVIAYGAEVRGAIPRWATMIKIGDRVKNKNDSKKWIGIVIAEYVSYNERMLTVRPIIDKNGLPIRKAKPVTWSERVFEKIYSPIV